MNSVKYLFYMELLNYLFCDMFGGILEVLKLCFMMGKESDAKLLHFIIESYSWN